MKNTELHGQGQSGGRAKTLLTDTLLFGLSNFGSKILIFFLTPLYTALLTIEEFGVADLINTTVQFIYPIFTLAIMEATLRYAMKKDASPRAVFNNSVLLVTLATLVLLCFQPLFGLVDPSLRTHWLVFVVTFGLFNLYLCFTNFIKGLGMTKLFAVASIVHTVALVCSNLILLLWLRWGLQGYLISIIIAYSAALVLMSLCAKMWRYMWPLLPDWKLLREMLLYSTPMIPAILAWSINTSIDKYMIIAFVGMGANGIYSAAHRIPTLLSTATGIFLQAWQLSAIHNSEAKDEDAYYTNVYRALHVVGLCGCFLIIPLSKIFSVILFDSAYYTAWQAIPLLTISAFFSTTSGFLAAAFRAHMKPKNLFSSVAIGALVNIVLNLLLIPRFGIIGAATATAISFAVIFTVRAVSVQSLVRIRVDVWRAVPTYLLLFLSSFLITFDVPFSTVAFLVSAVLILLIYYRDIVNLIRSSLAIVKGVMAKRKGGSV